MELQDRVAFVTGGGSGIGRAGALALAREGAVVVITDLIADRAKAVASETHTAGGRAEGFGLDVTDDAMLEAAMLGAYQRHKRLDILHSHARAQVPGRLDQVSASYMDLSWRINVRAHFVAAKAAMSVMAPRRCGSIIVTSSNSGVQYDREMIAYCTTKTCGHRYGAPDRRRFAKSNMRCNALCPGFIDTVFNAGFEAQMGGRGALENYVSNTIPMARFGTAEEMGEAVAYLASDRSSFMTGHALVLDGGESL